MTDLIKVENRDGVLLVSSRDLAVKFEKEHHHVVDAIENKIKNLTSENSEVKTGELFIETSFNHKGNVYKEYFLTRDGFSFIAMGFTGKNADRWKLGYIKAFNKMEITIKSGNLPHGKELLALAVLEAHKMIEGQTKTIAELTPKGIFADAVASSTDSMLVGELAKILKQNGVDTGQNRLFAWLRENGYLIKRRGTDYGMPTQKSMELKLFTVKETAISHSDGHITVNRTPKITGKGQIYFINKFNQDVAI